MEQEPKQTQLSLQKEHKKAYSELSVSDHGPGTWIQVDPNDMFHYEIGYVSFL